MRRKLSLIIQVIILLVVGTAAGAGAGRVIPHLGGTPVRAEGLSAQIVARPSPASSNGFTYQGRLKDAGNPANGQYDFQFALLDGSNNQIGPIITVSDRQLVDGLFTVTLDFGANVFDGSSRYLQIAAKRHVDPTYTSLVPRQPLTATPFAFSSRWQGTTGKPYPYNPLRQPNTTSRPDTAGNVGWYTSATTGADGLGLISYQNYSDGDLKVLHCANIQCSSAASYTLDSIGTVGLYTSITTGADGLGLISYYDATNGDLKVAHCSNMECSSTTSVSTLDSTGDVGKFTSLTIGSDGLGLISYYDATNHHPKVAHCSNVSCTSATLHIVDSTPVDRGYATSITVQGDGLGLIMYIGECDYWCNNRLEPFFAHCQDIQCSTTTLFTPLYQDITDPGVNITSLTTGADGLGLGAFWDQVDNQLVVIHCTNYLCNGQEVNDVFAPGAYPSITTGPDGFGIVTYYDPVNQDLKLTHCGNIACNNNNILTLDSQGDVGPFTSVTLGVDGLPLISYLDMTNTDLKVMHCANPYCTSYQHGR